MPAVSPSEEMGIHEMPRSLMSIHLICFPLISKTKRAAALTYSGTETSILVDVENGLGLFWDKDNRTSSSVLIEVVISMLFLDLD